MFLRKSGAIKVFKTSKYLTRTAKQESETTKVRGSADRQFK
jgi:hypothetical protein